MILLIMGLINFPGDRAMATIREKIEGFIYPFYEKFTDICYRNSEDSEFMGVKLLDDESKFTHGALVHAAATLYA